MARWQIIILKYSSFYNFKASFNCLSSSSSLSSFLSSFSSSSSSSSFSSSSSSSSSASSSSSSSSSPISISSSSSYSSSSCISSNSWCSFISSLFSSDICVTSSNAVNIVKKLPNKNIFFIPDGNLGRFVAAQVPDKNIILNPGYCHVHTSITADAVSEFIFSYQLKRFETFFIFRNNIFFYFHQKNHLFYKSFHFHDFLL